MSRGSGPSSRVDGAQHTDVGGGQPTKKSVSFACTAAKAAPGSWYTVQRALAVPLRHDVGIWSSGESALLPVARR